MAEDQVRTGHELSDLSPRSISFFGVGLAALVIVTLVVVYGIIVWFRHSAERRAEPPIPLSITAEPRPGPQLLVEPGQAMKAMRQQETARLESYGWIDQERGVVHVPIERAIEMLAKKGLPARPSKAPTKGDSRTAGASSAARQERHP
jgi:hypothetical protein